MTKRRLRPDSDEEGSASDNSVSDGTSTRKKVCEHVHFVPMPTPPVKGKHQAEIKASREASHACNKLGQSTAQLPLISPCTQPLTTQKPKFEADSDDQGVTIRKNEEGNGYIELGKKRRITVREFKGMQLSTKHFSQADLRP
jgi:hypothetical protein